MTTTSNVMSTPRQNSSRGRHQIEARAKAIGTKVAPFLSPDRISASLDTLAAAAYELQNEHPDVSESLNGLAVILNAARSSRPDFMLDSQDIFKNASVTPSLPPFLPSMDSEPSSSTAPLIPVDTIPQTSSSKRNKSPEDDSDDPKRRLKCNVCGKRFPKPYDLTRHIRTHTGDKPYICEHPGCGKGFIQKSALSVHARVHTGEKPYKCEYPGCSVSFADVSALTRHRRRHGVNNYSWKCGEPGCKRAFTRKAAMITHQSKMHPETHIEGEHSPGQEVGANQEDGHIELMEDDEQ